VTGPTTGKPACRSITASATTRNRRAVRATEHRPDTVRCAGRRDREDRQRATSDLARQRSGRTERRLSGRESSQLSRRIPPRRAFETIPAQMWGGAERRLGARPTAAPSQRGGAPPCRLRRVRETHRTRRAECPRTTGIIPARRVLDRRVDGATERRRAPFVEDASRQGCEVTAVMGRGASLRVRRASVGRHDASTTTTRAQRL
jgi:hypothetical protein